MYNTEVHGNRISKVIVLHNWPVTSWVELLPSICFLFCWSRSGPWRINDKFWWLHCADWNQSGWNVFWLSIDILLRNLRCVQVFAKGDEISGMRAGNVYSEFSEFSSTSVILSKCWMPTVGNFGIVYIMQTEISCSVRVRIPFQWLSIFQSEAVDVPVTHLIVCHSFRLALRASV